MNVSLLAGIRRAAESVVRFDVAEKRAFLGGRNDFKSGASDERSRLASYCALELPEISSVRLKKRRINTRITFIELQSQADLPEVPETGVHPGFFFYRG